MKYINSKKIKITRRSGMQKTRYNGSYLLFFGKR